ncbi:MAG: pyridoxine 5'-phosphate synthase [Acidiferrobacterales bacterium]
MIKLGVNIDHVATLRQARGTVYPEPAHAAKEAELAGADSITMHLREDRRHIQDRDIEIVNEILETRLNMEMAVTEEMITVATRIKPTDCCLVPEKREELTTEGGLDVKSQEEKIKRACLALGEAGIRVSLFIDADRDQLDAAKRTGAPVIEIHTGHFADTKYKHKKPQELTRIEQAIRHGLDLGLQVNAGHGLNYHNVQEIAAIPGISELNIGHAIIAQSIFTGLGHAVTEMKRLMNEAALKS